MDKDWLVLREIRCYNIVMDLNTYLDAITNKCFDKFGQFQRLLTEHNKICNLTSVTDERDVLYKHFLDSVAGEFLFDKGAEIVEIGSGGGFPSIPLKLLRNDLRFTLIESTGKKCAYLQSVVDKMGLDGVKVVNMRAEEGAHSEIYREKYPFACARAVARLNTLVEYCLPFVEVGGLFVAYKGDAAEEIKEAQTAVCVLGGEIEKVIRYDLPENYGARTLVCIRKVKRTPPAYPRGRGLERKKPL